MKNILTTTLSVVAWLSILPGLFFGVVGFIRSFDSYRSDEFLSIVIFGLSMFVAGLILLSLSYLVEAAFIFIEKNKRIMNHGTVHNDSQDCTLIC